MAKNKPPLSLESRLQDVVQQQVEHNVKPIKKELEHVVQLVQQETSFWSGPLPSPEAIEAFEKTYPGSAKIIFEVFQNQSNHRIDMEKLVLQKSLRNEFLGMVLAFILMTMIIGGGIYLIIIGKDGIGLTAALTGFCGILGLFFFRSHRARIG